MRDIATNRSPQSCVKLALAIGLTVIFVIVVAVQVKTYSGDTAESTMAVSPAAQENPVGEGASASASLRHARGESSATRAPWPEVDVSECTVYDPFATPEYFLPKPQVHAQSEETAEARQKEIALAQKLAAQQRAISDLMEAGVNAVLVGPDRTMALIGTQQLEVGDELHGHRVVAIEAQGIVLEPLEAISETAR
ncbi:MAG: hypothetical protein GXX96_16290 [Planctomycetaceae bacterium]|jgi:hypothetical protein|nr:hypothetical protein [Planctomycetaceae bacterium]